MYFRKFDPNFKYRQPLMNKKSRQKKSQIKEEQKNTKAANTLMTQSEESKDEVVPENPLPNTAVQQVYVST